MGPEMQSVPVKAQSNVTYFAGYFLILVGFINLYFIYFTSLDTWVNFKIYGVTILNLVMTALAIVYLVKKTPLKRQQRHNKSKKFNSKNLHTFSYLCIVLVYEKDFGVFFE